jgi:23S rRNA pseudouridine955/2504/2580 synthase
MTNIYKGNICKKANFMIEQNNLSERKLITVVEKKDDNSRFDKWLTDRFTYRSRSQWQEVIKNGLLTVNGKSCRSSKVLRTGDAVEFRAEDYEEPEVDFGYSIIYEDEIMLAVNKPANIPCHPAGIYFKNTLFTKLSEDFDSKIYPINRLDRETSGIVLFAKSSKTAKYLSNLFMTKQISKEYIVVVHGAFPEKFNVVGYLTSDDKSPVRKKRKFITDEFYNKNLSICDSADFEKAETSFELIKTNKNLSLVKVLPATGRLHQIRATLCSLGYPVVGDKIYGLDDTLYLRFITGELSEDDKCKLILDRQALHAKSLNFIHPAKKQIRIEAPVPDDFAIL